MFIRYYIGRGRLLFCPCSGCKATSLTELGVGYARENSPLRLVKQCGAHGDGSGRCGMCNNLELLTFTSAEHLRVCATRVLFYYEGN